MNAERDNQWVVAIIYVKKICFNQDDYNWLEKTKKVENTMIPFPARTKTYMYKTQQRNKTNITFNSCLGDTVTF
jgi:hypothetical protein